MPIIPPWLQAPDVAGDYAKGLALGTQAAEAKQRLQAEQARTAMEAQLRSQMIERQTRMEQARLQAQTAYHQQQLELRNQRLQQFQQVNDAHLKDTALKAADQQGFAQDLAGGMSVEQALYRHPRLTTPGAAVAAHKDTLDEAGSALGLRQQGLDLAAKRLEMQQQALQDREARPDKIGTMDIPLPAPPGGNVFETPTLKGVPLDSALINQVMGTNAPPGVGTNYPGRRKAAGVTASPTPFQEGAKIRSKKDGKLYTVQNGVPVPVEE